MLAFTLHAFTQVESPCHSTMTAKGHWHCAGAGRYPAETREKHASYPQFLEAQGGSLDLGYRDLVVCIQTGEPQ